MILGALWLYGRFAGGPSADSTDSSWLSGLARVDADSTPATVAAPSPRHAVQSSSAATSPAPASGDRDDLKALVRDQKRVIEALEAEKASLNASLGRLSQVESSTCIVSGYMRWLNRRRTCRSASNTTTSGR